MDKRMLRSVLASAVAAVALAFGTAGPLDVGWRITSDTIGSTAVRAAGTGDVGWQVASAPATQDVGWVSPADADA
jgi:hypothetical protein